jgi:uroporphyrinogen-III synthase
MTGTVVITRPRDEAEPLACELEQRGYATLVEPLLDIVVLPAAVPPLGPYRALAFTSVNGVRAFADKCADRSLPAYAVGARTAAALRQAGFRDVRDAGGDARALAALILRDLGPNDSVLHPSGVAVAQDLAAFVQSSGIRIDRLPLYDAQPAKALSSALVAALYARTVGHVLFFSARTAATFGTLVQEAGLVDIMGPCTALCLSDAVAAAARALPWAGVAVACAPTKAALLSLLPAAEAS